MSKLQEHKQNIIEYGMKMTRDRLVRGSSGNISIIDRDLEMVMITPTGTDYESLSADQVTVLNMRGERIEGHNPSSETSMHMAIYLERKDVLAVVHTHSMYATTFATLGRSIPAIHYMVTTLGGDQIPVTDRYELYGTEGLARSAVQSLGSQYHATLLRSHGVIAVGKSIKEAYQRALVVEEMAELYYHTQNVGNPVPLNAQEVHEVLAKISNYGKQQP